LNHAKDTIFTQDKRGDVVEKLRGTIILRNNWLDLD